MSWIRSFFTSSIGKKVIMAITGLFLCLFLVIHMAGNFQLLIPDGGQSFNAYAHLMTSSPIIKIASWGTYLFFLLHAFDGLYLAYRNRQSRPLRYAAGAPGRSNTSWASRSMALLGALIFFFLIVHMKSFWFEYKFGHLPTDQWGNKDLYQIVKEAFSQWWYVAFYLLSLIALSYHLMHGFQSAFRTLGLMHNKYTPIIQSIGLLYSIGIPLGFAIQPLYMLWLSMNGG